MIQFPNLHCWLIEIFITLTAFWPLRILNLWKIQKSLVTKGRIWTKSHCLDPTSWKTAFRYTYMCVCGLMYFSNCRVGSKDSCCHSIFSVCMCTLEQCKFWLCVCVILCVWWLSVWPKTPGCLSGEIRTGMENPEFARHLFSFTWDLNYVLASAGVQAQEPLLSVMLSSRQQAEPSNHEKDENIYFTVKCDTHTLHTNWVEKCLHEFFLCWWL